MKLCCSIGLLLLFHLGIMAQNVGIGTNTPTSPLTVISNGSGKGIIQKSGDIEIGFYASGTSAYVQTWSNHNLLFATNNQSAAMILTTGNNLGIGTATPLQKLHVVGGAAITGNLGVGTTTPSVPLHVVGNSLLMGNVGIGTTTPTASLDINGGFRIRGTFPKKGSVLTSDDANGNANWADPVAFKTAGLDNLANVEIPENVWTKVEFNRTPLYNLSFGYQPLNSQFQAIEGGVYHFDAQFTYSTNQFMSTSQVRMVLNRNGSLSTIAFRRVDEARDVDELSVNVVGHISLSTDVILQPNDIVWMEVYVPIFLWNGDGTPRNSATLAGSALSTWFSGHLVARN